MPDREQLINLAYEEICGGTRAEAENVVDAILAALKPEDLPVLERCSNKPFEQASSPDWPDDEAVERAISAFDEVAEADVGWRLPDGEGFDRKAIRAALKAAGPHVIEHWVCDDGDVFPTHEAAVEHMRMVDAGESSEVERLRSELQRIKDESHRVEAGVLIPSWSDDLREIERLRRIEQSAREADDLLRRLDEWDTMNVEQSDGPYWKREIARVRAALNEGSEG